ncbi:MAG TPA: metalloprotease PmbA [Gammaproteobacteria bacterium]|nr:metalloprotease PmbA [Gammaproteobacteria bacterium]
MTDKSAPDTSPILPDQQVLAELVGQILDEASGQGASAAEAGVSMEAGLSATVRLGEVETLEYHRDRGLGVTVYFGQRKGSASTSDLDPKAVRETVRAACDIARYTSEDSCAGLADAALLATDIPDLDLYHPWSLDAESAIELARECEDTARSFDNRIDNSEGASVSSHQGLRMYGNSLGFVGGYPSTRHSLSCAVLARLEDQMQRDYWYTVSRVPDDLEPAAEVGRKAAERTVRRLGGRRLSTRQVPVVFAAELASSLFGHLVGAVRGASLYRRSSFLLDHLGKEVFRPFVRVDEQPHRKRALGSAPFDNEGVATRDRDLIRDGVLQGYVLDSYSARKLGMQTTGNAGGVHNLTVEPGSHDLAGLLRQMGTGLLVTELMGQGINMVTGDYSRGAAGFWVEGGEIQYPVEEITVAGNLKDMFAQLAEVGSDVDRRGNIHTGSVLLESMTVAGE